MNNYKIIQGNNRFKIIAKRAQGDQKVLWKKIKHLMNPK